MPEPSDLNSQIAQRKGWTWSKDMLRFVDTQGGTQQPTPSYSHWQSPQGYAGHRPDYVGTLEGVSGMLRELGGHAKGHDQYWVWGQNAKLIVDAPRDAYYCAKFNAWTGGPVMWFWSPDDRPGDCVGDAYMSVFGKEAG